MAPSVYLLMAIHCHQPVGNFGFVFDEAFQKAYEPFVAALEGHPAVRVALHYSGGLLDWFEATQPRFLDRLRKLVVRGQIELLGSGYYEPILPMIPDADREGQLQLMQQTLERHFGTRASGLWLTERVWEPELPLTLARGGVDYTLLDTNQFRPAAPFLPKRLQVQDEHFWDLLGSYATDYAGASVTLFPTSKRLRYWLPFQEVSKSLEFLRRLRPASPIAITYADDGEKFGLWPKTHEWVYQQGWLERWFTALEQESSWLTTATFSQYRQVVGCNGQVYLPCGSYEEMLEWSDGYFRNFLVKYPEAHAMYRKMVDLSRRLQAWKARRGAAPASTTPSREDQIAEEATRALYRGQCNDAYWHGVFGGLYLANLRRTVYSHLITAEDRLRRLDPPPAYELRDIDGDGHAEVLLHTESFGVVVDPEENGTVTELDEYRWSVNLIDTLARRYEPYHDTLKAKQLASVHGQGQAPASIHDALTAKEEGLEKHLAYDDHRRSWFIDYALSKMPSLQEVCGSTWSEHRLWSAGPWQADREARTASDQVTTTLTRRVQQGLLRKRISLFRAQPRIAFGYEIADLEIPVVALEFNLCVRDAKHLAPGWQERLQTLELADPSFGMAVRLAVQPTASLISFPIETISDSEEGLERTVQGLAVVCLWATQSSRRWSCSLEWSVRDL